MIIQILESAATDLRNGAAFYDHQEVGLGAYFRDCLFSDIESLVLYGGMQRKAFGFYKLLSKRFPYAIYYKILEGGDCLDLSCPRLSNQSRQNQNFSFITTSNSALPFTVEVDRWHLFFR